MEGVEVKSLEKNETLQFLIQLGEKMQLEITQLTQEVKKQRELINKLVDNEHWIDTEKTAKLLDVKPDTIKRWRKNINHPLKWYRNGKYVRYKQAEVLAYKNNE